MITKLMRKAVQLVPWRYRGTIKDLPLIGPAQRYFVSRLLAARPFLHTVDAGPARGLRVWVQLPDDKQIWTGTYESEFANLLADAVRPGDICLDIGGYHGFFSGVFALAGAGAVHIFEPLPSNISRIQSLIGVNPNLPLVLHQVAMGAAVGATEFVVMPETTMGKLSNSSFQEQQRGGEVISVHVETLDHLTEVGAVPQPDLIKIDVEGAEAMVLGGAARILEERRPQLFIEVHSRHLARQCNRILVQYGYTIRVLETGGAPDFEREPEICHFLARPQGS